MVFHKIRKKWILAMVLCGTIVVTTLLGWRDKSLEELNGEVPPVSQRTEMRGPEELTQLRQLLIRLTYEDCEVLNWAQYDPVMPDTPILLVTVHANLRKLRSLIAALQQAYPDQFPGVDPNDCGPDGMTPEGCVKRDARRAESKHHWWWSTRFVFESLEWSGQHRGMVVFLQEDSVVQPRLLLALRLAERALIYFPKALLVWLVPKTAPHGLLRLEALYEEAAALPALNATAWRRLNSMHFCMYDDSSWRYSLLATVRMGGWVGVHANTGSQLHSDLRLSSVLANRLVWLWGRPAPPTPLALQRPPGGFSDVRDQLFCLDPLINTPDSFTLATDNSVTDKTLYYNFTS